jgi:hypothetical protein
MSLKAVHIAFISLSALLCFGFGVWSLRVFGQSGGAWLLVVAVVSMLGGIGLIVYGIRFLRKLRHVSFF